MNTMLYRVLTGICLLGLMTTGCDPEEPGGEGAGGEGGGGQIDGGVGGEGGVGGQGGEGGVGGGEGGAGGGDPMGPCGQLNEAQCGARDDCAAFTDVFGDFSRCQDASEAACRFLDADQCAGRDDCAWDAEAGACGAPTLSCADHGDARACQGAGCFWYGDACHEEPQPIRCDQPDPASCEAAGCQWGEDGCIPACADFAEPACNARPECRWNGMACEPAPHMRPCDELAPEDCVGRADCTWFDGQCIDAPEGPCGALAEDACVRRPDCEPIYGDGAGEVPVPPEGDPIQPPPNGYEGCQERIFDCGAVPLDACERTPGCEVVDGICSATDPDGCAQLDPRRCDAHPRCRSEWEVVCGDEPFPGDGDEFFPGEPCEEIFRCLPDEAVPACEQLDLNACVQRRDCQLIDDPACGGMGMDGAPPPDGADRIAPACVRCAPAEIPAECWDLDEGACNARGDCRWNGFGGGPVPAPDPEDCGCPPDDPACGCGGLIAPGGFCEPIPDGCWDLNEAQCIDRDGCRWVAVEGGGGEPGVPLPFPCDCPDDDPDCVCVDPVPVPPPVGGGFCEPDGGMGGCWDFGQRECLANPGCEWFGGIEVCECFEDGFCECWIEEGVCRDRVQPDPCANLDEGACVDAPECEWLEGMIPPPIPCECPPGEDCVCPEPPVAGGFCVWTGPRACADLGPDECEAAGCQLEEVFPPCAEPCNPADDPNCAPVECEPILICVDRGPVDCGALPIERCEAVDGCRVERIDVPCPPPCDPDDPNCGPVMCPPVEICVGDAIPGRCQANDPDACRAQGCDWIGGGGACECVIGPDGQEICRCEDGGFCQEPEGGPNNRCDGLPPDACVDAVECWAIDCDVACQGDPQCLRDCGEVEGLCVAGAEVCPGAPIDICPQIDACEVVVDEVCRGGCDDAGNCEEPICERRQRCEVRTP